MIRKYMRMRWCIQISSNSSAYTWFWWE